MKNARWIALASAMVCSPAVMAVDLLGVYELAQANDAQLRAAEQQLAAAGEGPVQARSVLLPQLSGGASRNLGRTSRRLSGNSLPSTDLDTESYSIQLRQTIYDDANYGRLDRSRAQYSIAQAEYEEAWQSFLFRVTERYFDVLTALDSVRFARAEETALRRQFEQADQRFEVGLAAVTDVHEARAVYDAARARVILVENQLEDAREALREVAGARFENYARLIDDFELEGPDPADPEEWIAFALDHNPQLLQQRSRVDSAEADLRVARAGRLPSLDLTGNYTRNVNNEFIDRDPATQAPIDLGTFLTQGWQVSLNLSVPIFEGFAIGSRRRQAGFTLSATDEIRDQVERAVVRQTDTAYRAIIAGIREVEARRQALVSAESALEATNAGFEVGTRTIVDVLVSEQRFFQAERDYSLARHQFILNRLRLRQVAGLLDEDDLARVNQLLR